MYPSDDAMAINNRYFAMAIEEIKGKIAKRAERKRI